LTDARDVEDAFQATFLILARKGRTLGEGDPVGHWLYGVACRVAMRARTSAARRRLREHPGRPPEVATVDDPGRRELGAVIDQELARLPSKYRAPVVLCYLEGLTHEEAGRQLGWPLGTVKGRLARARDLLRGRLARRGVAPSAGPAAVVLARAWRSAVPSSLLESTIKAAMAGPSAGMVPGAVASLVAGSLTTMFLNKLKVGGALLLVLGTGAAVMAFQASKGPAKSRTLEIPKTGEAKAAPAPSSSSAEVADWDAGWPSVVVQSDQSPGSAAIRLKLDERIAMSFPNDTPLGDVKRYIEQATQDHGAGLPNGIPIYVDPQGLQDTDKTMASTVSINLEGIPLRTTLELALRQLGLTYRVKDGLLIIESANIDHQGTPFNILEGKAMRGELTREQYKQLIEMLKLRNEIEKLINPPSEGGGGIDKTFTTPKF
jgi:RNA polymerase sigma factor (sigma-70 family)